MSSTDRNRVLAIGLDAADPVLARRLVDAGELPHLRALLGRGCWGEVQSLSALGTTTVWPSFHTGQGAEAHGIYGDWVWNPARMTVERDLGDRLVPFWKSLALQGRTIGTLDVPYAPLSGLSGCSEIAAWGPYDWQGSQLRVSASRLAQIVAETTGPHPLAVRPPTIAGPHDLRGLTDLIAACLDGIRKRGALASRLIREHEHDLALIVFTELHHASHPLWHTVEPDHPVFATEELRSPPEIAGGLVAILREVDRQVGEIVANAGPETTVVVFSPHGMQPTRGLPNILDPLLRRLGFTVVKGWAAQSWPERGASGVRAVKRRVPQRLKDLYYRSLSRSLTYRIAQPAAPIPICDWRRTRAVAVPIGQHGAIRLNLAGREAEGVLNLEEYRETCRELRDLLQSLRRHDGAPLVADVLCVAEDLTGEPPAKLPDILVHWTDAAHVSPLRLEEPDVAATALAPRYTGKHSDQGFFIVCPSRPGAAQPPATIKVTELHRMLEAALAAP
ncbi:MAG: alkaline phosphatase family protein [Chloroflexi bacterium]|nr:alkaline phosphatase family protein [Chloroflexota bacterium]